jgi:hypothetical protein
MQVRMLSARGAYGYPPHIPPRASDTRSSLSSGFTASSPPRKVVTDFAAFGASRSSTVYGTAVQSTPFSLAGNKAAFGSIRTTAQASVYDDDDEEEEQSDGRQRVLLREDPITLDQVTLFFFLSLFLTHAGNVLGSAYRHAERMAWHPRLVCLLHTLRKLWIAFSSLSSNCASSFSFSYTFFLKHGPRHENSQVVPCTLSESPL